MAKRKQLPGKRHKGLFIYCHVCKKHFTWTKRYTTENGKQVREEAVCGKTKKSYSSCPNFSVHKYKSRVNIPNTSGKKETKVHDVTTYNDAVSEALKFEKEVKAKHKSGHQYQPQQVQQSEQLQLQITPPVKSKRYYMIDLQASYLDFLENVGVAEHKKRERSNKHLGDIERSIKFFNESLAKNDINFKMIFISQIQDTHVGYYHSYLLNDKSHANRTYNNNMGRMKSFVEWSIKTYKIKNYSNPFEEVNKRSENVDNETITKVEFNRLLEDISPLTGSVMEGKSKKNRYRSYLKDAFELGLHTGGRREEVVELKWNMIREVDNEPAYIIVPNLKVERQKGEGFSDNVAPKIIPVTTSLYKLLLRLGYNENKGSHEYLLEPDRKAKPLSMMEAISKGFSHYYGLQETGRKLQFKHLRKTYLTYLVAALGDQAKELSSHSTDEVLQKHYINDKIVSKAVKKLEIFSD